MKRMAWWAAGAALIGAGFLAWCRPGRPAGGDLDSLPWGEVARGDLALVVSSTGTLGALDSVEVGTQVSGPITEIRVDFNDRVEKDQVLAVIDTSLLDAAVREANAGHARAKAQFDQAAADLAARRELFAAGLVSRTELLSYETAWAAARSSLDSADAAVTRARQNRENAVIRSPIDGVVVERAVEVGQTVAASFSTPRLFLLARDLGQMRILAEVDEGDIGQVRLDQEVTFQVAAYPDRQFRGAVRQIRLQPTVDQNVVKYTVVVDAANDEGLLLPGMTATLEFVVAEARDVLTVPVAATRVRPSATMMTALGGAVTSGAPSGRTPGTRGAKDGAGGREPRSEPGAAPMTGPEGPAGGSATVRPIYLRDGERGLAVRLVRLGLSDGRRVEILPLEGSLEPGTPVVVGAGGDAASSSTARSANPVRMPGFRPL